MRFLRLILPLVSFVALFAQTARFPGAVATDTDLTVAVDGVSTVLTRAMGAADMLAYVNSPAGIAPNMLLTIGNEVMQVSSVTGQVVRFGARGIDAGNGIDTAAVAHPAKSLVKGNTNARSHNALKVELQSVQGALLSGSYAPSVSSVPYTGATGDVDLGGHGLAASFVSTGGTTRPGSRTVRFAPLASGAAAERPACDTEHVEYFLATDTHAITSCDGVSWTATLNPSNTWVEIFNSTAGAAQWYNDAGELVAPAP